MRKSLLFCLLSLSLSFLGADEEVRQTIDTEKTVAVQNTQKTQKPNRPTLSDEVSSSGKSTSSTQAPDGSEIEEVRPEADPPVFDFTYRDQFVKMLIAIVIIILVALLVIWIIRRSGPSRTFQNNRGRNIKVIERRAISSQTYLYHIEVGGKQFIVAESKVDVRTLGTLDWPEDPSEL